MKKAIIAIGCVAILSSVAIGSIGYIDHKRVERYLRSHYIITRGSSAERLHPTTSTLSPEGMPTENTRILFKYLQDRFPTPPEQLDSHLAQVKGYLIQRFTPADAERLSALYRRYLACEMEIARDPRYQARRIDPSHLLVLLYRIHQHRRNRLGSSTADFLFGREVKECEYLLRRSMIIEDQSLYGEQKEKMLRTLKEEMWGEQGTSLGEWDNPYNRYQEKLRLYNKDLAEMDTAERSRKVEEFKRECFTPAQLRALEEIEAYIAKEKEREERYSKGKQAILDSTDLSASQKKEKIRKLQEEIFGKDAEAIRRREMMYRGE